MAKQRVETDSSPFQKRFEDALKKLTADLEMKLAQRDEMKEQQRRKKEGIEDADTDPDGDGGANDDREGGDEAADGELFDDDEVSGMPMEIG